MSEIEFIENVQANIYENIKFADQKATAFIAIDSAIFAGIFHREFSKGVELSNLCFALPLLALSIGVALAVLVIWPRIKSFSDKPEFPTEAAGLLLPHEITKGTVAQYSESVSKSYQSYQSQLAAYVYLLSMIYRRKYLLLKLCILFSAIGILLYAVLLPSRLVWG